MRRRDFMTILGGAAVSPLAARAQQVSRLPRVIYFANNFPDEPEQQTRREAFREGLQKLGWIDGQNVYIDEHWGSIPIQRMHSVAVEFIRSMPAVIVVSGSGMAEALKLETSTAPVVFLAATDPAASGLVDNMARPGGNLTGFTNYEFSIGGRWLGM